jgi:general secretion pathway protein F
VITFAYKTAGGRGGGTIEAADRASAVRELRRRGETPVSLAPVQRGAGATRAESRAESASTRASEEGQGGFSLSSGMSRAETAMLVRELATALQAGLPLVQAIRTIAKQGRTPKQRAMLEFLIDQVEHGKSLGDAMAAWGKPFSELLVSLVRAGEASGRLEEVMGHAAVLMDKDVKFRSQVRGALLYPAILGTLIVAGVIVVVTVIIPKLLEPLTGQNFELPWPTRVLMGLSDFFISFWPVVLAVIAGAVLGVVNAYRSPAGRLWIDLHLLRLPLVGRVLRDAAVARFTRTLGTLTASGLGIVQAMRVTKRTLGNRAMENVIDDVTEKISAGRTIAEPMERSGLFPPLLVQIVSLGERSGRLDELLGQAASALEERTESSVRLFTQLFPPVLIVVMAAIVGFVVLAIVLALLEFQSAVMNM